MGWLIGLMVVAIESYVCYILLVYEVVPRLAEFEQPLRNLLENVLKVIFS